MGEGRAEEEEGGRKRLEELGWDGGDGCGEAGESSEATGWVDSS